MKAKMIFSRKNTLKDDISSIIEKDNIHPKKYGMSFDRKIDNDKKVYFYKNVPMIFCTFMQTFLGIFKYRFSKKKQET